MAITRSNKSKAKSQKKTQSKKNKKVKVNIKKNTKQKTKKQVTVRGQKTNPVENVSIDLSKAGAEIDNDMNSQNEEDFKVDKDISNQDKNCELFIMFSPLKLRKKSNYINYKNVANA